ncbi:rCG52890 [Rattus norvegicus]|uniref:Olfactory receptor n=1 Tax=Rattus norvegicus TaxID=10116 RepID=A6IQK5_RAT|nr:rCG52890 [Rattus norvegicus]
MLKENHTMKCKFTLTGFTDHPEMKALLFAVFFIIYLITMVGNMGLVILISRERSLHTPMYIFLGHLALIDSCCACAITPKMLENFFSETGIISLYECMAQFYFLCTVETADCFLLAAMAYDRYVAICNPLQYHTMMSKKLCLQMTVGAFIAGNLHSMIHVGLLFRLAFCGSNQINHFYCDILPLYRLSCVDPYINELVLFVFSGSIQVFTIGCVLVSYLYIVLTIFQMKSKEGRVKAFSTCASHFLSVSLF